MSIELAGVGEVSVDIAFGGNFFAIVDSREPGHQSGDEEH